MLEVWRRVWREAAAPLLPTKGLVALQKALQEDDPRLLQGATTSPPPLQCVQDWAVEAACVFGFCLWQGRDNPEDVTVADVEEGFARLCFDVDQKLHEPAACRWFLNHFDESRRDVMRRELILEVALELERREKEEALLGHCN